MLVRLAPARRAGWLAAAVLVLGAPIAAQQFESSIAIKSGDPLLGGNVLNIQNVQVNDAGDWMALVRLTGVPIEEDHVIVKNGEVIAREGDALPVPGGGTLFRVDSFGLNAAGTHAALYDLADTPDTVFDDHAVFVDDVLLKQESDPTALPAFAANTTFGNMLDMKFNDQGEVLLNGFMNEPGTPQDVNALLRLNTGGGSSTTIARRGDLLPGNLDRPVVLFDTTPQGTALNNDGDALFMVQLEGELATNRAIYLVDDDQGTVLVAQIGDAAPGGGSYQFFLENGRDVNDLSQYVFKAKLDDGTQVLVTDAGLFIAEGDPLPGIPGETLVGLGSTAPVEIDNLGRVLWQGRWGSASGPTALFLDHTPVLQQNVTEVEGLTVGGLAGVPEAWHVSPSGEWIVAQAVLSAIESVVLVHVLPDICQTDLGFSGPGGASVSLCGGDLSSGTSADLLLTGAAPDAPAFVVLGLAANPTPFKGGQLVPVPFFDVLTLQTDAQGELFVPDVPGGGGPVSVVLQCVIQDAAQPAGFALSNALQVDFLP